MNEGISHLDTPQSICGFGIAHGEITPPAEIYCRMWGAATHDRATGVHRPLRATVMVFRQASATPSSDGEQVLICLDHCLFWAPDMEAFIDRVVGITRVPHESIVVTFSHSHAAGLMDSERASLPGGELIPPYLEELSRSTAGLLTTARESTQDTVVTYGVGHCGLAADRDYWDASRRQYVCGYNPATDADDTVMVARMSDATGNTVATIVNYACHPTSLAWGNSLISPDYPGAMREVVEKATGAPCVFIQGASGDLGPKEGYADDVEVADRNGRQLGYAALAALESLPPPRTRFEYSGHVVSGATVGTWAHAPLSPASEKQKSAWQVRRWTVELPYREDLPDREDVLLELSRWRDEETNARRLDDSQGARNARAFVERKTRELSRLDQLPAGGTFPYGVNLWRTGDALWVAVGGEPYNLLQRRLREQFPGVPIVVAVLANGNRVSYVPPEDVYGKDIYQEAVAVLAPGSLERLIEEIKKKIERML